MENGAFSLDDQHDSRELVPASGRPDSASDLLNDLRFGHATLRPPVGPLDGGVSERDRAVVPQSTGLPGIDKGVDPGPVVAPASLYLDLEWIAAGGLEHFQAAALLVHLGQPGGTIGKGGLFDRGLGHMGRHEIGSRRAIAAVDDLDQPLAELAYESVGETSDGVGVKRLSGEAVARGKADPQGQRATKEGCQVCRRGVPHSPGADALCRCTSSQSTASVSVRNTPVAEKYPSAKTSNIRAIPKSGGLEATMAQIPNWI